MRRDVVHRCRLSRFSSRRRELARQAFAERSPGSAWIITRRGEPVVIRGNRFLELADGARLDITSKADRWRRGEATAAVATASASTSVPSPSGSERDAHRSMQLKGENYSSGFYRRSEPRRGADVVLAVSLRCCDAAVVTSIRHRLRSGCRRKREREGRGEKKRDARASLAENQTCTDEGRGVRAADMWERAGELEIDNRETRDWRAMEVAATKLVQWFNELRSRVHLYLHAQTRKSSPGKRGRRGRSRSKLNNLSPRESLSLLYASDRWLGSFPPGEFVTI